MAQKRIAKELKKCIENPNGFTVYPDEENTLQWKVAIEGPSGSAYEGKTYTFIVEFRNEYPFKAPTLKAPKMYHPNIKDEQICLSLIDDNWKPAISMTDVFEAIRSLLMAPNTDNPLDEEASQEYINNYENFRSKVQSS